MLTQHWDGRALRRRPDRLIVEEPLEVHLDGHLVATTMRTPGHDFELAVGLVHGDGLLAGAPVVSCRYCGTGSAVESEFNVVSVDTGGTAPTPAPRLAATTTACGLCGSTAIEELRDRIAPIPVGAPWPIALPRAGARRSCTRARTSSPPPARCTPPPPSTAPARRSWCGRTSVATTPSTRSSAGCCSTAGSRPPTSAST